MEGKKKTLKMYHLVSRCLLFLAVLTTHCLLNLFGLNYDSLWSCFVLYFYSLCLPTNGCKQVEASEGAKWGNHPKVRIVV